jgi:hypothetical protein
VDAQPDPTIELRVNNPIANTAEYFAVVTYKIHTFLVETMPDA